MGGQGRGRTADLPLFRRTLVPTELPDRGARCSAVAPTAAVLTGFEPATSTLTGWRALRLLYRTLLDEVSPSSLARAYHRHDLDSPCLSCSCQHHSTSCPQRDYMQNRAGTTCD